MIIIKNKGKLKITCEELRSYLLENYINKNGEKISDRALWGSDDFMEFTGLYKLDIFTNKKLPVSLGTVSYWKKKLNILEEDVFRYHQIITKRINDDLEYETWSKKYNKGHNRIQVLSHETVKRRLIKYAGLSKTFYNFSFDEVSKAINKVWAEMGLDSVSEMNKFYASLYTENGGE